MRWAQRVVVASVGQPSEQFGQEHRVELNEKHVRNSWLSSLLERVICFWVGARKKMKRKKESK
jgi:hypothetical protein